MRDWRRCGALLAGFLVTLIAATWAGAWYPGLRADNDAAAVRQLDRLEHLWNQAFTNQDAGTLDQILAADFVFVGQSGQVLDKAGYIAMIVQAPQSLGQITDLEYRVYGNTAVVVGRFIGLGGNPDFRYIDHFVRRSGRWCAIASQDSRVIPPP